MKLISLLLFCIFSLLNSQSISSQINKNQDLKPVQQIIDYAFANSRVVMMNEVHRGQKRNIRSRIMGQAILPKAHKHGVRVLAMEALTKDFAEEANTTRKVPKIESQFGYLNQPEMINLMQTALDLGWKLVPYEAFEMEQPSLNTIEKINEREQLQAQNLNKIVQELDINDKILVWCGNSHLNKKPADISIGKFYPMGYQLWQLSGIEPFIIDQSITANTKGDNSKYMKWKHYEDELKSNFYGTLGFLIEGQKTAYLISIYNNLE